jgi:thiamine biosynthesis lipoprotein ApbE
VRTLAAAAAVALVAAAGALPARGQELQRFEFKQIVMAIEARVVLYAKDEATAKAAASRAFAELDRLDVKFSDYRADGIISQFNEQSRQGQASGLSIVRDLADVFRVADRMRLQTGGAFDIAAAPLIRCWRDARRTGLLPSQAAIDAAQRGTGTWSFVPNPDDPETAASVDVSLGTRFDLGGIAKGYAIARAADVTKCQEVAAVLIEMGGDLVATGRPPGTDGWCVDAGGTGQVVVHNGSVSVSGDSSQFIDIDGVRYSHVVDPHTGWPLTNGLSAAVVMEQACSEPDPVAGATCDALATAVTLLGPHEGRVLAERLGAALVRITDPSFHSLFDGKTLAGWTPRGGHYDGDAVWSVDDGQIVGATGKDNVGGLLYTATPHTSFEFQCETKLDYPFDSGIFVRMAPEGRGMQLTLDDRPDGEVGGLYSDGWIEHAHPEAATAWKRGEWNHVFLRCTGFDMRIEAWINGVPVMDRVVPQEFAADGKAAYAPTGLIGLQVHGGGSEGTGNKVRFRDIEVRDLPVFGDEWSTDRALSPPEAEARDAARSKDGWRDLLGGATPLSKWEAVDGDADPRAPSDYAVKDGVLAIPSSQPAGYLRTKADVRDFDLRLEVRQARMSNSGLFLRGRRESKGADGARVSGGNPAYSGCEIQLLDDWNWETVTKTKLEPWQFTGSLYGAVPPALKELKPIGEWNTLEVLARGSRMACALNGQTIWDVDTSKLAVDPPFTQRAAAGFIGLQRYAAPDVEGDAAVWVRGMYVREP